MIKKLLLLSYAASSLLATNGVNMIGTGTVSRSMGGTGVAHFSDGSGAMGKNVALIADVKDSELHLDVTYFSAKVSNSLEDNMFLNETTGQKQYVNSENHADTNFIPTMSYVSKINDRWSWGATMMGIAGMALDYNGKPNNAQRRMKTGMMLMKIIPAASYRNGNVTFGFAPVLGLGSMSLNYDEAQTPADISGNATRNPDQSTRSGLFGTNIGGEDLVPALGYQAGMDIKVTDKLRIGTTYQSSLSYTYKNVANFSQFGPHAMVNMANDYTGGAIAALGDAGGNTQDQAVKDAIANQLQSNGGCGGALNCQDAAGAIVQLMPSGLISDSLEATNPKNLDDLTLEQPWEVAIGFGYELTDQVVITGDYRYIAWGLAEGYKDFGWENQSVYAMGFEFKPTKDFRFRGGYNYADSPLKDVSGEWGANMTDMQGTLVFNQAISQLNMVGFPAIATTHFTLGAGYDVTDYLTFDGAFMYSPETEGSRSGALIPGASNLVGSQVPGYLDGLVIPGLDMTYEYKTKMQQMTLSLGMNYKF